METIKETVVCQVEKSDLDLVVVDEILGNNGRDYDWVESSVNKKFNWKENGHISIEMLQSVIDELKLNGATHLQIMPHSDHHGYYFTGVILEVMDDKEVFTYQKEILKRDIKNNTITLNFEKKQLKKKKEKLNIMKINLKKM